jgi:hypothetical protein
MRTLAYSPAGFRRAPVIPINARRRRGLGYTSADYAAVAASVPPGSALYQMATGCAQNPTQACADNLASELQTGFSTSQQQQAFNAAIAAGNAGPQLAPVYSLSQIPSVPAPAPVAPAPAPSPVPAPAPAAPAPVSSLRISAFPPLRLPSATPPQFPVQMVQPAGAVQPVDTSATIPQSSSVGLLSTTILGIPLWIWAIGGAGALYFLSKGGR